MLAFPNVSHPVLINVFRPFGDDQLLATLGAFDDRGVVRTKMHQQSLARDLSRLEMLDGSYNRLRGIAAAWP